MSSSDELWQAELDFVRRTAELAAADDMGFT